MGLFWVLELLCIHFTFTQDCRRTRDKRTWKLLYCNCFTCSDWKIVPNNFSTDLERLMDLERLEFEKSTLKNIPPYSFVTQPKLKLLSLKSSRVKTLEHNAFYGLENLLTLDLQRNHIHHLPNKILKDLTSLQHLYLNNNRFKAVNNNFWFGPKYLITLHLQHNNIHEIDNNTFLGLTYLRTLKLQNNKIQETHMNTWCHLPSLKELGLSANKITVFNKNVTSQQKCMKRLKLLHPESCIGTLAIDRNQLLTIKAEQFVDILDVRRLNLNHNDIHTIETNAFTALTLCHITMGFNKLKKVQNRLFINQHLLEQLRIDHNDIYKIGGEAFVGCSSLKMVDLRFNKLTALSQNLFAGLNSSLFHGDFKIDLRDNQIYGIPVKLFSYLNKMNIHEQRSVHIEFSRKMYTLNMTVLYEKSQTFTCYNSILIKHKISLKLHSSNTSFDLDQWEQWLEVRHFDTENKLCFKCLESEVLSEVNSKQSEKPYK